MSKNNSKIKKNKSSEEKVESLKKAIIKIGFKVKETEEGIKIIY